MQHDSNNPFKKDVEHDIAPMRHDEGDRHDDFDNHVDEKWLVSYADLMTLLFGLFVMLYVITVQKQGNVQESFQQISNQMSRNPSSAPVNKNISMQKPQRYTDAQYLAAYYETQNLKKTIADLNKELEILRPKANLTSNVDTDAFKKLTEKIKEIEQKLELADKKIAELKLENENISRENKNLKSQIADLEEDNKKLKKNIEDLKSEKEKLLAESKAQKDRISELELLLKKSQNRVAELEAENQKQSREIATLNNNIIAYKKEISDLKNTVKENKIQISKLKKEIDSAKYELQLQLSKNERLKSENLDLKQKISRLDRELETAQIALSTAQNNLKAAQNKIKTLQDENQKIVAKKNEYEFILGKVNIEADVPSKPIRDLASLKSKISNASVLTLDQQTKIQADLAASQKELLTSQKQVADLSVKMNNLNKELAETIKVQNSFLMVSILWTTAKHDLDLKIKDPKGNTYTYKTSRKPASIGEFVMDSRTGPGMEAWHSLKFVPGEYEATVDFYNEYGNEVPADVSLVASTNTGRFEISKFDLDFKTQKSKSFKFKLDSNGNVIK